MEQVTVLYFAAVADITGCAEEVVPLGEEDEPTVGAVLDQLATKYPALRPRLPYLRVARNEAFARLADPVTGGDVLAVLPPLAGG